MRRIFILFIALFVFNASFAQTGTDLEFSRTITVCLPLAGSSNISVGTVPTGKIWKVVGVTAPSHLGCAIYLYTPSPTNTAIYLAKWETTTGTVAYAQFPLFFNENTSLMLSGCSSGNHGCVSIIEYTVIP